MDPVDVVIMRRGTEGLGMDEYATELRNRLPDHSIVHATTPKEEREFGSNARIVTGETMPIEALETTNRLELFACTFAGVDHLPLDRFEEESVIVTNASGIHAPGIAEQVIGTVLLFARGLLASRYSKSRIEIDRKDLHSLQGQTVTIVGVGAIGTAVGERLAGFDVERIGVRHSPEKPGPVDRIIGYDEHEFHEALSETDVLVLACPLTELTDQLLDETAFSILPPTALVINVARGGVIKTSALIEALSSNQIRGAALDVTEPEPLPPNHALWGFENCLITPHMGGHTPLHWERLADIVATNLTQLETGKENLMNVVQNP